MRIADLGPAVARRFVGVTLPPLKTVWSPNWSERSDTIDLIVVHDTEGGYEGAVAWFRSVASQVSAHIVLREDGGEATQCVPYAKKAWHAAAYNSRSIGLELAGLASHGYYQAELRHATRIVAFFLRRHKLPPILRNPAAGHDGPGFTFHQYLGPAGGSHSDPGFSPEQARAFAALVKSEYDRGGFRKEWGV
jgi:N-acetyl-anhydromuramyl-L-alanine amidase AmpD